MVRRRKTSPGKIFLRAIGFSPPFLSASIERQFPSPLSLSLAALLLPPSPLSPTSLPSSSLAAVSISGGETLGNFEIGAIPFVLGEEDDEEVARHLRPASCRRFQGGGVCPQAQGDQDLPPLLALDWNHEPEKKRKPKWVEKVVAVGGRERRAGQGNGGKNGGKMEGKMHTPAEGGGERVNLMKCMFLLFL